MPKISNSLLDDVEDDAAESLDSVDLNAVQQLAAIKINHTSALLRQHILDISQTLGSAMRDIEEAKKINEILKQARRRHELFFMSEFARANDTHQRLINANNNAKASLEKIQSSTKSTL